MERPIKLIIEFWNIDDLMANMETIDKRIREGDSKGQEEGFEGDVFWELRE